MYFLYSLLIVILRLKFCSQIIVILTSQYTILSSQYSSISLSLFLILCTSHLFHFLILALRARMTIKREHM
jgi:hypothetical protein